jgi:hypothetical protein
MSEPDSGSTLLRAPEVIIARLQWVIICGLKPLESGLVEERVVVVAWTTSTQHRIQARTVPQSYAGMMLKGALAHFRWAKGIL